MAEGQKGSVRVSLKNLHEFLGAPKIIPEEVLKKDQIGVATGLAWTAVGGDVLFIEALRMKGKGNLVLTGQLGEVMRESAQAAYSYAKSRARSWKSTKKIQQLRSAHSHSRRARFPKTEPSAGITLATAMVSALSGQSGPQRCGDDRRDHAARQRIAGRRCQGKSSGGAPCSRLDNYPATTEPP